VARCCAFVAGLIFVWFACLVSGGLRASVAVFALGLLGAFAVWLAGRRLISLFGPLRTVRLLAAILAGLSLLPLIVFLCGPFGLVPFLARTGLFLPLLRRIGLVRLSLLGGVLILLVAGFASVLLLLLSLSLQELAEHLVVLRAVILHGRVLPARV